jgi:hypothetical protein
MYLYSMSSRLVNVRLDAERVRKVQRLRERGVTLSTVVREAIDDRFASLDQSPTRCDVKGIIARMFDEYPDPPDLPARRYDVHNRLAARRAILRRLRSDQP